MAKTRHMHRRMGQRGINARIVDIVIEHGELNGDKVILDIKNIDALLRSMDKIKKDLLRVRDKGGVVVVEDSGSQITTYNLDSYRRH
ncbi:MAG: DUF4258 domain-containing protein [Pseudohongiellaceae bacterium]|nr:DUF4258 domain-containing protein [Pseudohongiellaceae bacterium]